MKRIAPRSLVLASVAFGVLLQPYRPVVVNGVSMFPALRPGEVVLASKIVPTVRKGDVVVIKRDGETIVKRVAYVGGEKFRQIRLGGEWMMLMSDRQIHASRHTQWPLREYQVPEGTVYVLGDNLGDSLDSRTFGPVPITDVKMCVPRAPSGQVSADYWSRLHV